MNTIKYTEECKRTWNSGDANIEHCAYGLVTESAEIMDMLKKHKLDNDKSKPTRLEDSEKSPPFFCFHS